MSMLSKNTILLDILRRISDEKMSISGKDMRAYLKKFGFLIDDPRWKDFYSYLDVVEEINAENCEKIFCNNIANLGKCVNENFIIGNFESFSKILKEIFENQYKVMGGEIADYIPQLARQNPNKYGMSFCSTDGQRFNIGDYDDPFCVQSCCKPINYGIAIESVGLEYFSKYVGKEPSGKSFQSVAMNSDGIPYNPMVNAGAIMTCSLVEKDLKPSEKFDKVLNWWTRLAGGYKPGFDISTYLSEKDTGWNNYHLAYYMKSSNLFPEKTDFDLNTQFYFQCCAIEMSCKKLAVVAATLANGGVCPLTHEKVFQSSTTKHILSLMYSCGMSDYSGQFAFKVGLPAKSGVSGCVMVVVPNVGGFCTWSPRLDKIGKNSTRGITFFEELVSRFTFHNFDGLGNLSKDEEVVDFESIDERNISKKMKNQVNDNQIKIDPLRHGTYTHDEMVTALLFAAFENDINTIRNMILNNVDLNVIDYDKRTALHVAASEGCFDSVKMLIDNGANINVKDRFNNTPLDDAARGGHSDIIEYLIENDR